MARKVSIKSVVGSLMLALALWVYATLNTRTTAIVEFPLSIILPVDRATEGDIPEAVQVKIRASGWELLNLRYLGAGTRCILDFTDKPQGTSEFHASKNHILQGLHPTVSLDKITEITPESFGINTSAVVEKRVPVSARAQILPRPGFMIVGGIIVRPDSITIRGNAALLQNISAWKTDRALIRDANGPLSLNLQLQDSLTNKVTFQRQIVQATADIQLVAEQVLFDVPVEIINVPMNNGHEVLPRRIAVTVRGGVNIVRDLLSQSFKMQIDYASLKNDSSGIIIPVPTAPAGVEIIRVEPSLLYHFHTAEAKESQLPSHQKGI